MSIKYAILGLLSWKPSTGYDMKKIFEESSTMYWSGNNNQIYKSLVQLLDDGLVTSEVLHQEGAPSKKLYTITDDGLAELKEWVLSEPEAPDFKKTFLIQLAWAEQISSQELKAQLSKYENEINIQLIIQQEKLRRGLNMPNRSDREAYLWSMISENLISSYRNELDWVQRVRKGLFEKEINEERSKMNYKVVDNGGLRYIEFISSDTPLETEQDVLEIISLCYEHDTNLIMLHEEALSQDFFRLKTGVAGNMLQKLVNYRVKTAAVLSEKAFNKGRFKEMASEANKGTHFRIFDSREAAEAWLLEL